MNKTDRAWRKLRTMSWFMYGDPTVVIRREVPLWSLVLKIRFGDIVEPEDD